MRKFTSFLIFIALLIFQTTVYANDSSLVYVFEINDEIAQPVWHNTLQMFEDAENLKADVIIIDLNTYGGQVDMADSIRTAILRSPIPVYVLINNNAASAGALISIACKKIYMMPGSTIGAATVVTEDGAPAIDKYQSYFRSKMRATAEVTGRDPDIAEAMVDQDIEIEGITKSGKLLTFTVTEAIANNFCEKEVSSIREVIKENGLNNAEVVKFKPTTIDKIIGFLVNPAVSGILIMLMMGGIYFELQSPGIGFPLAAAAVGATLFFAPLYIEGMADNWEIILFIVGILALAVEILIIPGTGITGILGVTFIVTGLTLSMVKNVNFDFSMVETDGLLMSFAVVLFSLLTMMIMTIVLLPKMLASGRFDRLVLTSEQNVNEGYIGIDTTIEQYVGQQAIVVSDLRPSGKIEINHRRFDASSAEAFISKGERVTVIGTDGPQLIVRK